MTAPRWCVGIDPGASGGIAVLPPKGSAELRPFKGEEDALAFLLELKERSRGSLLTVCLESPGFFFGGPAGNAVAKLQSNVGWWRGATQALSLNPILVAPQAWQKPYKDKLPTGLANRAARKKALCALAKRKDPRATLKTCDALLIAIHAKTISNE